MTPKSLPFLLVLCAPTLAEPSPPAQHPLVNLSVDSVVPTQNALDRPTTQRITIDFNQAVNLASVQANMHVFGRWSGVHTGQAVFVGGQSSVQFQPDDPFSSGEMVKVVLSKDILAANGRSLGRGFAWSFWVKARSSRLSFTQTAVLVPGDRPYGAYGGDLDGDGDLDLCVPNEISQDVAVFLNDGSGSYPPPTNFSTGAHSSPNEGADFNGDGHIDLAVANAFDHDISVLLGNGDGTFQPQVQYASGMMPRGLTLLDADGDADTDIVTANRAGDDLSLFLNNGDGTFAPEIGIDAKVWGETAISACDMDNDGIFDLVVAGYLGGTISVLRGQGDGSFKRPVKTVIGPEPWMLVTGDIDADGFNDVAVILSGAALATAVVFNDGNGYLSAPTLYPAGGFSIALDLGDLDGDGMLDLATSSFIDATFRYRLNNGTGGFGAFSTLPAINAGSCTLLYDFDDDGDLDIAGIDEIADRVILFEHDG